jgi:hypothetical protein
MYVPILRCLILLGICENLGFDFTVLMFNWTKNTSVTSSLLPSMNLLTCLSFSAVSRRRLSVEAHTYYYYPTARPRRKLCACRNVLQETAPRDAEANPCRHGERKSRRRGDGAYYIDKDGGGVARTFDRKKISRKRGTVNDYASVPVCHHSLI